MITDRSTLSFGLSLTDNPTRRTISAGSLRNLHETLLWPYRTTGGPKAIWLYRPCPSDKPYPPHKKWGNTFILAANREMLSVVRLSGHWPYINSPTFMDYHSPGADKIHSLPVPQAMALIAAAQHLPIHWDIDFGSIVGESGVLEDFTYPHQLGWSSWPNVLQNSQEDATGAYVMSIPMLLETLDKMQLIDEYGEDKPVQLTLDGKDDSFCLTLGQNGQNGQEFPMFLRELVDDLGMDFSEYRPEEFSVFPTESQQFVPYSGQFRAALESCPDYELSANEPNGSARIVFSDEYLYVTDVPRSSPVDGSFLGSSCCVHVLRQADF